MTSVEIPKILMYRYIKTVFKEYLIGCVSIVSSTIYSYSVLQLNSGYFQNIQRLGIYGCYFKTHHCYFYQNRVRYRSICCEIQFCNRYFNTVTICSVLSISKPIVFKTCYCLYLLKSKTFDCYVILYLS